MVQVIELQGFDAFVEKMESLKAAGKTIFAYFSGSKDANGKSWCPDCVVAEPVVMGALSKAPEDAVFLFVDAGGRDFWKDPQCVFRTDPRTRLRDVPTLLKIGGSQRLVEEECAKTDMVEMLFEDA